MNNNNQIENYYIFKLLLVGDFKVGKTSILLRYADNTFTESYLSSIGVDFKIKQLEIDNDICKIQIWDAARGCERFRSITSSYYRGLHGVIFVYDITDLESFSNIKNHWYKEYYKYRLDNRDTSGYKYNLGYDYETYIPQVLILGTKSDLRNQSNFNSCVDFNLVREFANSINALSFEVSSKDNIGIDDSIYETLINLKLNYIKSNGKKRNQIIQLNQNKSSKCIIN